MIHFQKLHPADRQLYLSQLEEASCRGCEYSFVNKYLWGDQRMTLMGQSLLSFSLFDRHAVYPFPTHADREVVEVLLADAAQRGITCCLTAMNAEDCRTLEALFPGQFCIHRDRDADDYVYAIEDLASLKGRKYQKKRNHVNKFKQLYPDYQLLSLQAPAARSSAQEMLREWYAARPEGDYHMEQRAMARAFVHWEELELEGLAVLHEGQPVAFAIGSRLNADTYDIHFEKASEDADGAYAAINQLFAQYLQQQHPEIRYLNREDDLGLEGLRKAKLSYEPHHLVKKYWASPMEDEDEL